MQKTREYLVNFENFLLFISVCLLPTQLGKHFWPQFSSIYSLRIDYLSPVIYFWDLLIIALILTASLKNLLTKDKLVINKNSLSIILFFLFTQLLSFFTAENLGGSLVRFKDLFFAAAFGTYLASLDSLKVKKIIVPALFVSVLYTGLISIGQFLIGRSLGLWVLGERTFSVSTPLIAKFSFYDHIFLRPYATFPHPNLLAGFLVISLPLLIYGLSSKFQTLKYLLALFISGLTLTTFSRPGILLSGIYILTLYKRFWKILLILTALVTPLLFVRFTSILTYDQLALLRRQELSEYAVNVFLKNPLLGIGLNNFINSLAQNQVLVGTSRFLQPAHNIFLLTLAETGIVGLFGLTMLIGSAVLSTFKSDDPFKKALLSSIIVMLFLGLFDHYFLTLPQGERLLFLLIGLSLQNKT